MTSAYLVGKLSIGLLFALSSASVKPCILTLGRHKKLKTKQKCPIEAGEAALLSCLGIDAIKMGMLGKAGATA